MDYSTDALFELARLYGVQTAYIDSQGIERIASHDSLLSILQVRGAPISSAGSAPEAARHRRQEIWQRLLDPISVAWSGSPARVKVRLPRACGGELRCMLHLESGDDREWTERLNDLTALESSTVEGVEYVAYQLIVSPDLPWGYHRLKIETVQISQPARAECTIISAPVQSGRAADSTPPRWGVFLPLYALHSQSSWGCGDFSDLAALLTWVTHRGGAAVATLPILATFLNEPFDPSPYAPASRLFWNEMFIDVARAPELPHCPAAAEIIASAGFQAELHDLRQGTLVDYRRQMTLKRRVLAALAQCFFERPSAELAAFRTAAAARPQLEDYARFRAVCDRLRIPWHNWPDRMRDGTIDEGDFATADRDFHLYVQWLAEAQLQQLADTARAEGSALYLDLPLGVNSNSYDVWRERNAFASGASAGAPPDPFFPKGQNWGFPPLHPERIQFEGYRYVRDYVRQHLRFAGTLRLDHVMGLSRLFWIPDGAPAHDGLYVEYGMEHWFALFSLEARRHNAQLVGEDLGTVPAEIPAAMQRHNMRRMYVVQFAAQPRPEAALPPVFADAVASLNTHDMPTFAAFWKGLDIEDRLDLRILDESGATAARQERQALRDALQTTLSRRGLITATATTEDILKACLFHLTDGNGNLILVGLEDLWLEEHPQNVPGTWQERPNWRRKARFSLEEIMTHPAVVDMLSAIDSRLRSARPGRAPG